ncbi:MAG: hypothetical protein M5R41_03620 [Bacteroidia bacterium]|nr:hypothetical protein [Bacteroidia bacterium]
MSAETVICGACGGENSLLALRCDGCGAYLRDRVPALDLFSTLWGMLEAPRTTFLRIARSEQKNYTHLLFAGSGPVVLAAVLAVTRAGDTRAGFVEILASIAFGGPVAGLLHGVLASFGLVLLTRLHTPQQRYRDAAAALAWSLSPLLWLSVLILPLQLGIFGVTLFSENPAAWNVQPLPYWLLITADAAALLWTLALLLKSQWPRGGGVSALVAVVLAAVAVYAGIVPAIIFVL